MISRFATKDASQGFGHQSHRFLSAVAARGRSMLRLIKGSGQADPNLRKISELAEDLLSVRGETAGRTIAGELFDLYRALSVEEKISFLNLIADGYGPDEAQLRKAVQAYLDKPDGRAIAALRLATDSPRQVFIRRLNLAENGTLDLLRMREDALKHQKQIPNFDQIDADFSHVITPWFNIGFLELRQMQWSSSANVLHKIISYEAVHEIKGWDDLRRRVEPADRRCYAFFHPRMPDEPLIFVEVALTREIPASIGSLLDENRTPIAAENATTAVFYSISNCQDGLRGIPFGNMLIKRVVELLSRQLPLLRTFVTLSPVPRFASWLAKEQEGADSSPYARELQLLEGIGTDWSPETASAEQRQALLTMVAHYLVEARTPQGKAINSVARFHLGNGAHLERINFAGDLSPYGLKDAHGMMVNYLYDRKKIDTNAQRFAEATVVATSKDVMRLLQNRK